MLNLSATGTAFENPIGFIANIHYLFHQRTVAFRSTRHFSIYSYHNYSHVRAHLANPNELSGLKVLAEHVKSYDVEGSPYLEHQLLLQITSNTDVEVEVSQRSRESTVIDAFVRGRHVLHADGSKLCPFALRYLASFNLTFITLQASSCSSPCSVPLDLSLFS